MLISMYQAAKLVGYTKEAIRKKQNLVPRPGYFVDMKKGVRIDTEHPEWKLYLENIKLRRAGTPNDPEEKIKRVISAVISVLTDELGLDPDELKRIVTLIDEKAGV